MAIGIGKQETRNTPNMIVIIFHKSCFFTRTSSGLIYWVFFIGLVGRGVTYPSGAFPDVQIDVYITSEDYDGVANDVEEKWHDPVSIAISSQLAMLYPPKIVH